MISRQQNCGRGKNKTSKEKKKKKKETLVKLSPSSSRIIEINTRTPKQGASMAQMAYDDLTKASTSG